MTDFLSDLQTDTERERPDGPSVAQQTAELDAEARRMIEHDKLDERQQLYMKNATTGKLVRTAEQYHRLVENKQGYVSITYNQALDLYRQEEGVKKRALAAALAKKRAKASRKKNRNG